jgi:hypothetical protein
MLMQNEKISFTFFQKYLKYCGLVVRPAVGTALVYSVPIHSGFIYRDSTCVLRVLEYSLLHRRLVSLQQGRTAASTGLPPERWPWEKSG